MPDEENNLGMDEDFIEDEPIPARRDVRIFHRKKEDENKDDDFDEDVFV